MANATPVHKKSLKEEPEVEVEKAETPEQSDGIKEVPHHPVVSPGQVYKLPDGTIVRDN